MFCNYCGNKLFKQDCDNCLSNSNNLKEFEEESE